ncbi:MAG: aminopeptidase, partial [Planctomycetota bacterium]|nr:aminopeptidase [Planctomycetota bacterium]
MCHRTIRLLPAALGLLLVALSAGCSGYLLRQGMGQLEMVCFQREVEDVLADPCVADARKERIRLVLEVKRFAEEELGYTRTDSYTCYYNTGGRPVAYALVACPEDSLSPKTWTFFGLGAVPYLGFFDISDAREEEGELKTQGFDTFLAPIAAYSTLGWMRDPILSWFLCQDEIEVTDLVIHELTHATIFFENDVELSENVAVFCAREGTRLFLARRHGPSCAELDELDARARDSARLSREIEELAKELEALYEGVLPRSRKLAEKAVILRRAGERFRRMGAEDEGDPDGDAPPVELNNAIVAAYRTYHGALPLIESLHRKLGNNLKDTVSVMKSLQDSSRPREDVSRIVGTEEILGNSGNKNKEIYIMHEGSLLSEKEWQELQSRRREESARLERM